MRHVRVLASLLAAASSVLVLACQSENELIAIEPAGPNGSNSFKLTPEAVQGDESVARDAVVDANRITLPFVGHEALDTQLRAGSVFFADRAPGSAETNPLGFMVKVVSLGREGDRWVIQTQPASLQEVFEEADFDFPLGNAPAPSTNLQSLEPLQEGGGFQGEFPIGADFGRVFSGKVGSGTTTARGKLSLSGGFGLLFKPSGNLRYQDRGFLSVPNLAVDLGLGIDLELGACAKVEGILRAGKSEYDGLIAIDGEKRDIPVLTFPLPAISVPVPTVPPPLVVTVRYEPTMFCGFNWSRSVGLAYQYKRSWQFNSSFGLRDGSTFATGDMTDTGSQHRWEFVLKGGMALTCGIDVKAGFYFYNSLGAYVKATPRAELSVTGAVRISGGTNQPTEGQAQACAGVDAVFETKWGLEASAFGVDVGGEWPLLSPQRFPIPFPMTACGQTFTFADVCEGKSNGLYCSSIDTKNSYRCQNNTTAAGGTACADGQYCQTQSGVMGSAARLDGQYSACASTPPRPEPLDLKFCPPAPNFLRSE